MSWMRVSAGALVLPLAVSLYIFSAGAWILPDNAGWWGVLAINQGGMAYHGGLLGVIASTWFIARMAKQAARDKLGPDHPAARISRGAMMLHINTDQTCASEGENR